MKIVFCDNSLKELLNFRGEIIRHFVSLGHSVFLIAPKNTNISIPEGCILIESSLDRGGTNPIQDLKYLLFLQNIYYKIRPDIVFHYTIKPNIYGSIAARICKIKSVAIVTGLGYVFNHNNLKSKVARSLYKIGLKFTDKIITLNQHNFNTLLNLNIVSKEKLILLPGGEGVNLSKYL